MPYRRPAIKVIEQFQQAAAALALPTLPACIVGPGFQIADNVNCGHFTSGGSPVLLAYAGLDAGAIVDLSAVPATVPEANAWKGVGVTLANAYEMVVHGTAGAAVITGDINISGGHASRFIDPTASIFAGFDPAAAGAPSFYVEITGGTALNSADLGRKYIVAKVDANTLTVAVEFVTSTHVVDVAYRILAFYATDTIDATTPVTIAAGGVTPPAAITSGHGLPVRDADVIVAWRALRPDLANALNVFTDNASLTAIFGTNGITPSNPGAYAVNLALQNTTTPVNYTGLDANFFTSEELAWQNALAFLQSKDVYALAMLTHNTAVHQDAKVHVEALSNPAAGRERVCFISRKLQTFSVIEPASGIGYDDDGIASSTLFKTFRDTDATFITDGVHVGDFVEIQSATISVGSLTGPQQAYMTGTRHKVASVDSQLQVTLVDDPTLGASGVTFTAMVYRITRDMTRDQEAAFIAGYSSSFASRRVVHTWPDILAVSLNAVVTLVPGYFAGAVLAGMTAGLPSQAGFTNLSVAGFVGRADSDDRYTDTQLDTIAGGGTLIFTQPVAGAALGVRHQLTTDLSTIYFQEFSVTKNVDLIARFFRGLFAPFIGPYNITQSLLDLMKTRGEGGIVFLLAQRAPRVGAPLKSGSLSRIQESTSQPDSVEVDVKCDVPLPLNNVTVTLFI